MQGEEEGTSSGSGVADSAGASSTESGQAAGADIAGQARAEAPSIGMDTELPADLASKFGVKTLGEAYSRYSSSSSEGRRLAEERSKLERELEIERAVKRNIPQPAPQKDDSIFGFKDQQDVFDSLSRDFKGTYAKIIQGALQNNPEFLDKMLEEKLNSKLEPYQQQQARAQEERLLNETFTKYPEFASGGAYRAYIDKWHDEGGKEQLAIVSKALRGSGVNAYEIMAKAAAYDLVQQQGAAQKAAQAKTQQKAVVANNGTGTQGKKVPENKQQEIEALLDEEEQQGAKIPKEVREATIAAFAPKAKNVRLSKRT